VSAVLQRWAPSIGKHCVAIVFSLTRPNELNFTQLIAVTFATVRPVARISQLGSQKSQGGTFLKYNIECMQQPLRKKSLRHVNFIHTYLDPERRTDMNAEPAEHRHLLYCNLGKGGDKK